MRVEAQVQELLDRSAIERLIYRYADSVTRADWDQNEALWAPDAVFEVASPFDFRAEGPRGIRDAIAEGAGPTEMLINVALCPVVELLGSDVARATTQAREMVLGETGADGGLGPAGTMINVAFWGVYYDDLVKIGGDWKFARRYSQPIYLESGALVGAVTANRSALLRSAAVPPPA